MIPVYAQETFPTSVERSLFLAGPTPRENHVKSWRDEALRILADWDGHVFVPEDRDGSWNANYDAQIAWEEEGLHRADAIAFWVPRELKDMPGFTTNVEFGMWYNSGKVYYGRPDGTPKASYLDHYALNLGFTIHRTLDALLRDVTGDLADACPRSDGGATVPRQLWLEEAFQFWLGAEVEEGKKLLRGRVEHAVRGGDHFVVAVLMADAEGRETLFRLLISSMSVDVLEEISLGTLSLV
jgi:hypothetical protein